MPSKLTQVEPVNIKSVKSTKWLFIALCFYIISQSYTIPIIPIGPWAVWPCITDFATVILAIASLSSNSKGFISSTNKIILLTLVAILCMSIFSYVSYLNNLIDKDSAGSRLGAYQVYRLVQSTFIFWAVANIPLTQKRVNFLKIITTVVLIFVCLSVLFTFSGIIPMDLLTAHLPQNPDVAGPWYTFALTADSGGKGWGTIGYNHAYVAVQINILATLTIHLGRSKNVLFDLSLLLLSLISCLISESRAGLFSMIAFSIIYMLNKPAYTGAIITLLGLALIVTAFLSLPNLGFVNLESTDGSILERQATLLDASNTDNLSGRDEIWSDRVIFLNKEPIRWIIGIGFGAAWDYWSSGESAHMLALHVIVENGFIGFLTFSFFFYQLLYFLYRYESGDKALYWSTIVLLIASLTQETFYPVPAFGHFIGFYLCSVAIALRKKVEVN
jgi:hypothetical protein